MRYLILILLSILEINIVKAQEENTNKSTFFERLYEVVKDFSRVDTNYITPQKYNYAAMVQNTNTFEHYVIRTEDNVSVSLNASPSIKLGPYFGWRWIFLGYTLDLKHLGNQNKSEFDISLYSARIGIDLFYRKVGGDYNIRRVYQSDNTEIDVLRGSKFTGFTSRVKGFNLYYIFNNKRFSYPAAFSQSTIQRKSSGSLMAGIGYSRHSISMDWLKLNSLISEQLGDENLPITSTIYDNLDYTDISASCGYGYNFVFARNWLLAGSVSASLGYKRLSGETHEERAKFSDYVTNAFIADGIGRFGLVYNNMRWFAGTSAIFRVYNFKRNKFSLSNSFGNINVYIGFNFGKR